ncbi:MAG TPA: hypothetical protein VG963_24015 [Polyangiaceae bacterium]|nr:hypothetical protein [Polyangiaceae bacterium]
MLRPSSYVIRINTHESDRVLLVHGYTKAVDLVPTRIADLLEQPNREITEEHLSEANQKHLLARGHLTEMSVEEERKAFVGFVGRLDAAERARKMPGFVLLPTYLCNLDCFYCYQKPALESDADLVKHLMATD